MPGKSARRVLGIRSGRKQIIGRIFVKTNGV
jgi:hypothetical protein